MSHTGDTIRQLLEKEFHPQCLHVEDESWKHAGHAGASEHGGGHYVVHIKSEHFSGLPRSQCHRMIYQALGPLFPSAIHALSIQIDSVDE